jgi:hypothetical protein
MIAGTGRYVVLFVALAACTSDSKATSDSAASPPPEAAASSEPARGAPITLTAADIDGFERGIARESHLVREGQVRASKAVTPVERGNAIQSTFEENTMAGGIEASGLSLERYRLVRQTLSRLLTTLDFQGKIDGPQSVDTAHADAEMKARLASDPYSVLDPASAELVKSRLDGIVKAWLEYINLTAVSG